MVIYECILTRDIMTIGKESLEIFFAFSLLFNALLFIPQSVKIIRDKSAKGVSLLTFLGLVVIQLATIIHAYVTNDVVLFWGYILSIITTGCVVVLILIYRKK